MDHDCAHVLPALLPSQASVSGDARDYELGRMEHRRKVADQPTNTNRLPLDSKSSGTWLACLNPYWRISCMNSDRQSSLSDFFTSSATPSPAMTTSSSPIDGTSQLDYGRPPILPEHLIKPPAMRGIGLEEAQSRLDRWCDSYSRLPEMLVLHCKMERSEWLRLLGLNWSSCDNISSFRRLLRDFLPDTGPVPELMDHEEVEAYMALPDQITVYRGCGPMNMMGASWTLDREVAAKFPTLHRYWQAEPLLVTGKVRRHHVLAVKLDRKEMEIITFRVKKVSVERLPLRCSVI